jgi:transposase-like protein
MQRTKIDFAHCMNHLVDGFFPEADKVVVVLDNLNTHVPASLYEAFEPAKAKRIRDRLDFHYTPKHGSWLNTVEIDVVTPKNWTPTIVHVQSVQERGNTVTKRRTFKPDFKARVVLEELTGVKSTAEICRDHQLKPQVFSRWKAELLERAPEIFATRPSRGDEQERIAELERMVGRLTMELEAAKKVSNILTSHLSRNDR